MALFLYFYWHIGMGMAWVMNVRKYTLKIGSVEPKSGESCGHPTEHMGLEAYELSFRPFHLSNMLGNLMTAAGNRLVIQSKL
jgi:hypothetical protein